MSPSAQAPFPVSWVLAFGTLSKRELEILSAVCVLVTLSKKLQAVRARIIYFVINGEPTEETTPGAQRQHSSSHELYCTKARREHFLHQSPCVFDQCGHDIDPAVSLAVGKSCRDLKHLNLYFRGLCDATHTNWSTHGLATRASCLCRLFLSFRGTSCVPCRCGFDSSAVQQGRAKTCWR